MISWLTFICYFLLGITFYYCCFCRRSYCYFPPGIWVAKKYSGSNFLLIQLFFYYPGPAGVPLLGSLSFISSWHKTKRAYEGVSQLHHQYGPVLGFFIGPQPVVSFAGSEACREALHIQSLAGRPDNAPARLKSRGKRMGLIQFVAFYITNHLNHLFWVIFRFDAGRWGILVRSETIHAALLSWLGSGRGGTTAGHWNCWFAWYFETQGGDVLLAWKNCRFQPLVQCSNNQRYVVADWRPTSKEGWLAHRRPY